VACRLSESDADRTGQCVRSGVCMNDDGSTSLWEDGNTSRQEREESAKPRNMDARMTRLAELIDVTRKFEQETKSCPESRSILR
jgi:hypothetical protein